VATRLDGRDALRLARTTVVSAHKGREVEVDRRPTCQHCGRRVADYLAVPWSLRCPECRRQATSG
jgi:predicted Zn-ribbon and HTH transcriptional regulator